MLAYWVREHEKTSQTTKIRKTKHDTSVAKAKRVRPQGEGGVYVRYPKFVAKVTVNHKKCRKISRRFCFFVTVVTAKNCLGPMMMRSAGSAQGGSAI